VRAVQASMMTARPHAAAARCIISRPTTKPAFC
jgi:hypothetical protein